MTAGALAAALVSPSAQAQTPVDSDLPEYKAVQGISGSIKSVGSDTMNNEMTLWAEGFREFYPNVRIEIEGKGSATAPPALIEGSATFGPMSREMKSTEIDDFEKKFGYKPKALATSIDMLALFVNKDNPLKSLTIQQVDAIFSKSRKQGSANDITSWGQLGLAGEWASAPISLYGRNSASGTYGYFKEHALGKGDYKDSVKEQPGSSSVVQGVAKDKFAIGYSGIGAKTADVNSVAVAPDADSTAVVANLENAYSGEYPLSRFLWLYVNIKPGAPIDPLRAEFIKYVLSRQGQQVVVKDGYYPLTAKIAAKMLKEAGIGE
ncbi:MAG: PstS family phosphate ABC transporter substrate-binding protein [Planctomycetia bacterium]|nr:PstS family phosphate ABC transporter substrate-binding protein [Planctomycetia bacterium]